VNRRIWPRTPPVASRRQRAVFVFPSLIEAGALDLAQFQAILTRHGLLQRWQDFERQFLAE
jgi:hypothetical protein